MFIGHYAAGLALKSVEKKASLGMLFIAVQLLDYLFFTLAPLGIEKFNLVKNYTAVNHYQIYYYPYSHGLLAAFLWSGAVYILWRSLFSATGRKVALVMALAVLSHWLLDLIVHTPDLPLLGNDSLKVGFGLWHYFAATYILEVSLLVGALMLYLRATTAIGTMGKYAMIIFVIVMIAIYTVVVNTPFNPDQTVAVASFAALAVFTVFTAVAFWLDRYRV